MIGDSAFSKSLLWISLAVVVGSYICLPLSDPDLWWHIAIGKWILAHGTVPHVDYWNMFSGGATWRAYSWSSDLLFAIVDRASGIRGLLVAQLISAISLAIVLQVTVGRIARDHFIGALFGTYGAVACFNHFSLSPKVFGLMFFAIAIALADEVSEKGISRRRLGLFALLGCLWANTHLSVALGLLVVFMWAAQSADARPRAREAFMACAALCVGTFLTPYCGGEWLTFFDTVRHPFRYQTIAEFKPATILQFSVVFVLLLVFVLVVVSYTTRTLPTLLRGAVASMMLLLGATVVKFLPFAAIVWISLFAVWWRQVGANHRTKVHDNFAEGILLLKRKLYGLSSQTGNSIVFFAACIAAANIMGLWDRPMNMRAVPKSAVDFIQDKRLPYPVVNEFSSGGYLMYRFTDDHGNPIQKVAIDGRINITPDEVWRGFEASSAARPNWRGFIDKVQGQTIMWRQGSPLISLLVLAPEWCQVFASGGGDEDTVVFVRSEFLSLHADEFQSPDCPRGSLP